MAKEETKTEMKTESGSKNSGRTDIFALWSYHYELKGTGGLTLRGYSRGGERSGFTIPALSVMFDAGIRTHQTPDRILITHCHCDHSYDLPIIMAGNYDVRCKIYSPVASQVLDSFITSSFKLMGNTVPHHQTTHLDHMVDHRFQFKQNNKLYEIETFRCYHTVPTIGYGISEFRQKVKKEIWI